MAASGFIFYSELCSAIRICSPQMTLLLPWSNWFYHFFSTNFNINRYWLELIWLHSHLCQCNLGLNFLPHYLQILEITISRAMHAKHIPKDLKLNWFSPNYFKPICGICTSPSFCCFNYISFRLGPVKLQLNLATVVNYAIWGNVFSLWN